jgi:putative AdoMet-dependent methyltransferase
MENMSSFPPSDFDAWSDYYDKSVLDDRYPFTGYTQVLAECVRLAEVRLGMTILDLGAGTGNLAMLFAPLGCELWCTDFSNAMLVKARQKIPQGQFLLHDLRTPFPPELGRRFDRVVSAYVFHHFELGEKIAIIQRILAELLKPQGKIVIADLSFLDRQALERVKLKEGTRWDDEAYWIAEEILPALEAIRLNTVYIQVSECAGIFTIKTHSEP